jgi:hypothetical protein
MVSKKVLGLILIFFLGVTFSAIETINVASKHPYPNNYKHSIYVQIEKEKRATKLRVHFEKIELAPGDYLYILDNEKNIRQTFSESYTDVWSVWIPGRRLFIKLVTDSTGTAWGYKADKVEYVREERERYNYDPFPKDWYGSLYLADFDRSAYFGGTLSVTFEYKCSGPGYVYIPLDSQHVNEERRFTCGDPPHDPVGCDNKVLQRVYMSVDDCDGYYHLKKVTYRIPRGGTPGEYKIQISYWRGFGGDSIDGVFWHKDWWLKLPTASEKITLKEGLPEDEDDDDNYEPVPGFLWATIGLIGLSFQIKKYLNK